MKPHLPTLFACVLLSLFTFAQTPAPERTAPPETPAFKKLIAPNATVEKLASGMGFTEGPLWHRDGYLIFTDVPRSKIMKWDAKNGLTVFREPTNRANGLGWDKKGRLVACEMEQRRVSATEADGKVVALADKYNGKRLNSTNDLTVGRDGAVYFSDPGAGNANAELDFNGVYRISAQGELTLLTKDVPRPNGITFAPDGKTLYVADMGKQNVHAFDLKRDGAVANGRIFATIYPHSNNKAGVADGIKTDVKGNLYVTGYGGVWVFDKKGQTLGIIATPEIPSNCAFGDADFKTLYITARTSLYRIRLTVAGAR